ncbi:PREDICTED: uncharacterized protein LOC104805035 isoform X2 [Tarenaya hassleriana]|uniref:uncharacterized protein LOC104805035 isoform X2 n=1 Tax=Tarenaya hassleriana TaxID=28532 RepID=UPI00053C86D4|nr:PREDICTED: uncharacterized protein LOC104805035 isoform X2 [Tarenaya hassleriana]
MKYVKPLSLAVGISKTKTSVQRRLLGLDVGDKYVGLAISDASNKKALPLSVLLRTKTNIDLMATDFQNLISKFSISGLVVGYPLDRLGNIDDGVGMDTFIEELHKTGKLEDVKYSYWDERLSSKAVEMLLEPLNIHQVKKKTMLDKCAAVGILQGYLDFVNKNIMRTPSQ